MLETTLSMLAALWIYGGIVAAVVSWGRTRQYTLLVERWQVAICSAIGNPIFFGLMLRQYLALNQEEGGAKAQGK